MASGVDWTKTRMFIYLPGCSDNENDILANSTRPKGQRERCWLPEKSSLFGLETSWRSCDWPIVLPACDWYYTVSPRSRATG